jgi:hypothetical protein
LDDYPLHIKLNKPVCWLFDACEGCPAKGKGDGECVDLNRRGIVAEVKEVRDAPE